MVIDTLVLLATGDDTHFLESAGLVAGRQMFAAVLRSNCFIHLKVDHSSMGCHFEASHRSRLPSQIVERQSRHVSWAAADGRTRSLEKRYSSTALVRIAAHLRHREHTSDRHKGRQGCTKISLQA